MATVSVSQAGQDKDDYPDKNRYHSSAGWVLGFGREANYFIQCKSIVSPPHEIKEAKPRLGL